MTKMKKTVGLVSSLAVFLTGCGGQSYEPSELHITEEKVDAIESAAPKASIPSLVKRTAALPDLQTVETPQTYSISVNRASLKDVLYALARDGGENLDIDGRVEGVISINVLDQTMDNILERIALQVPLRYERRGSTIVVLPDEPYYKQYKVNYVNISRSFSSSATFDGGGDGGGTSSVSVNTESDFWTSLEIVVENILDVEKEEVGDAEDDAIANLEDREPVADSETSFEIHKESGIVVTYAYGHQHRQLQEFFDRLEEESVRQVLLEATVVEVLLSNQYSQGIDWSIFNSNNRFNLSQNPYAASEGGFFPGPVTQGFQQGPGQLDPTGVINSYLGSRQITNEDGDVIDLAAVNLTDLPAEAPDGGSDPRSFTGLTELVEAAALLQENNPFRNFGKATAIARPLTEPFFTAAGRFGDVGVAIDLLSKFGDAKVMSSPRISTLNNQAAVLKVVDNQVYFIVTTEEETEEGENGAPDTLTITAEVEQNEVPVGFTMSVIPQISKEGRIILNVRPTLIRILGTKAIPTIGNASVGGAVGEVPIVRVREMASVMTLNDGEVAVMGGFIEDWTNDTSKGVPGLESLPGVGNLFQHKNEKTARSELVVFLRAKVIKDPSMSGDFSEYRNLLPDSTFMRRSNTDQTLLPPAQLSTE